MYASKLNFMLFVMATSGFIAPAGADGNDGHFDIEASYLYGKLDGFLQTPSGGRPGSSSRQRPTFGELGFDRQSAFDAWGRWRWGQHGVLLGMQLQRQSGKSVLERDLVSQNRFFAKGSTVDAKVQTDWYRLDYLYSLGGTGNDFDLSVGGGLVWFNFHYQLKDSFEKADRAYSKVGYRVGADLSWKTSERFSLNTRIFAPLPLPNTPEIWTVELDGRYGLGKIGSSRVLVTGGIGYNRLDYEDEQRLPNHIRVTLSPYFKLGLMARF